LVVRDQNGVIVENEPLWVVNMTSSDETSRLIPVGIYPILFDSRVISGSGVKKGGGWDLVAMDVNDGTEKWRWTEDNIAEFWLNSRNAGLSSNIWVQLHDDTQLELDIVDIYGINIENGTTSFRYRLPGESLADDAITHKGKYYFHYFPANDSEYSHTSRPVIYEGDVQTGQFEELIIPKIDSVRLDWRGDLGNVRGITAFEGNDGHDYLLVPFSENQIEEGSEYTWTWGHLYIGLYDLSDRKYVYEKMPITENARFTFESEGVQIFDS